MALGRYPIPQPPLEEIIPELQEPVAGDFPPRQGGNPYASHANAIRMPVFELLQIITTCVSIYKRWCTLSLACICRLLQHCLKIILMRTSELLSTAGKCCLACRPMTLYQLSSHQSPKRCEEETGPCFTTGEDIQLESIGV